MVQEESKKSGSDICSYSAQCSWNFEDCRDAETDETKEVCRIKLSPDGALTLQKSIQARFQFNRHLTLKSPDELHAITFFPEGKHKHIKDRRCVAFYVWQAISSLTHGPILIKLFGCIELTPNWCIVNISANFSEKRSSGLRSKQEIVDDAPVLGQLYAPQKFHQNRSTGPGGDSSSHIKCNGSYVRISTEFPREVWFKF